MAHLDCWDRPSNLFAVLLDDDRPTSLPEGDRIKWTNGCRSHGCQRSHTQMHLSFITPWRCPESNVNNSNCCVFSPDYE